ncbi:hypothetical protein PIB30_041155 [Stylosanthes scabra]|uniref:Uncharacterized protein n=1 Tax=Stylosanthes scabra TaxID=79078 RepID=A0ABU6UG34_9FABA|nr:hypothetical protein [Stylosanthes scabra]
MTFMLHSGDWGLRLVRSHERLSCSWILRWISLRPFWSLSLVRLPVGIRGHVSQLQRLSTWRLAPAFHPWGTPPSWEYPVSHSGSGGSQNQSAPPQQPPTVIHPQPRRTQRQRQAPACGTSSHLQPPHQHQ